MTGGEIHQWVDRTKEKAIEDQLAADWSTSNTDGDDAVSWQEYKVGVVQSEHNLSILHALGCMGQKVLGLSDCRYELARISNSSKALCVYTYVAINPT